MSTKNDNRIATSDNCFSNGKKRKKKTERNIRWKAAYGCDIPSKNHIFEERKQAYKQINDEIDTRMI